MGNANLVLGILLIALGSYLFVIQEGDHVARLASLIFVIPIIVAGILFLRKYDKDRKKSENS